LDIKVEGYFTNFWYTAAKLGVIENNFGKKFISVGYYRVLSYLMNLKKRKEALLIYFLVNNNYHLTDAYTHCKHLKDYDKSLIQIPHLLDTINSNEIFSKIYIFLTPFKRLANYFNLIKIKKIEKNVIESLKIASSDVLFVYTEYEVLNQFIIRLFKKSGAKVYIIEDGGLPTYLTYSVKSDAKLPIKKRVRLLYLKYILGYRFVEYLYYNKIVFPQINEKYIDGVLLYLDVNIARNIKKYILKKHIEELILDKKKGMFLNSPIYDYYCTKQQYALILDNVLYNMSNNFQIVYFKFHPRESVENKKWQTVIIKKYTKVHIIEEEIPIENTLEKYNAKYIFSFLSAALLNVNAMGAVPVYIYHMHSIILRNNLFKQIDLILRKAEYTFINSYESIESVGFKVNEEDNRTAHLNTFLERENMK
jgi:hypothetical protein